MRPLFIALFFVVSSEYVFASKSNCPGWLEALAGDYSFQPRKFVPPGVEFTNDWATATLQKTGTGLELVLTPREKGRFLSSNRYSTVAEPSAASETSLSIPGSKRPMNEVRIPVP